jgi:protein-disulfide isomerase
MSLLPRRLVLVTAALLAVGLGANARAADTPAATPTYREFIWGDPKAKVTVIEYASLTCPHCARFANEVFPEVEKNYIKTGKVRFVFRDYPLDGLAMAGAALARCAPGDRGKKMIELMYKNQLEWVRAPKPLEVLRQYAALAGMSNADVDNCLKSDAMFKTIREEQTKAASLYQVQSTPTFYIGDDKVEGEKTYADFSELLDEHIKKAK